MSRPGRGRASAFCRGARNERVRRRGSAPCSLANSQRRSEEALSSACTLLSLSASGGDRAGLWCPACVWARSGLCLCHSDASLGTVQACPVSSARRRAERVAAADSGGFVDEVRRGQPCPVPTREAVPMWADTRGPALGGAGPVGRGCCSVERPSFWGRGQPRNCWGPLQPWAGSQGVSREGGGTTRHWVAPMIKATEGEQWRGDRAEARGRHDHLRRHLINCSFGGNSRFLLFSWEDLRVCYYLCFLETSYRKVTPF